MPTKPETKEPPEQLIAMRTGDWWQDDRRNWCAYCGVALRRGKDQQGKFTRDHVIPRAHKGRKITIPSCRPCNQKKAASGLPQFMLSPYFVAEREKKRAKRWPLQNLWLAMALAAVEQARSGASESDAGKSTGQP